MIQSSLPPRLIVAAVLALFAINASADVYPSKAITLLVGYPPGGSTDLVARTVAPKCLLDLEIDPSG